MHLTRCVSFFAFVIITRISICQPTQPPPVAILDLTTRNQERNDGHLYSASHLISVGGLPFRTTIDIATATQSQMIVLSSLIDVDTFTDAELKTIRTYVEGGGVIVVPMIKDPRVFSWFGISDYSFKTRRYTLDFLTDRKPEVFRWINDQNEKQILLGNKAKHADVIGSRGSVISTGQSLANFDDGSSALTVNGLGKGFCYLLGVGWRDVVLRNQVAAGFDNARTFSNGFEPATDVFMLLLKGIFTAHQPFAVWKHTSGLDSKSTLVVTHDVDATSAIRDMMNNFSSYEELNGFKASYFITTHYMHDSLARDFWTGYDDDILEVKRHKHEIMSHSVSHVPDFDQENIIPVGAPGHTRLTYQPFFDGKVSRNVSVFGEAEVSRQLLEGVTGIPIRSYRTGYLAFHQQLLNVLAQTNYTFNSSHSANNVCTAFPFYGREDQSMNGALSPVLEIPNTISDIFNSDPISESNYPQKVDAWVNAARRNTENFSPNILLIHPNRYYKIIALQNLIARLPAGTRIRPFEYFGDYWIAREKTEFFYEVSADQIITIKIKNAKDLHPDQSFIVHNGQAAKEIIVLNESNEPLTFMRSPWEHNSVILHTKTFNETYQRYSYQLGADKVSALSAYPNPASEEFTVSFELSTRGPVILELYNSSGRRMQTPFERSLDLGPHKITYSLTGYAPGMYFYRLISTSGSYSGRFVVKN